MWGKITYPYQNFDDATFEEWKWISNFIPHCSGHRLTMLGLKLNQCYIVLRSIMSSRKSLFLVTSSWGIVAKTFPRLPRMYRAPFQFKNSLQVWRFPREVIRRPYLAVVWIPILKRFFILRRHVEVYPDICPILMGFLYFYLSMGHFEITVTTNSSDLRNYHIKKTRPAWLFLYDD